MSAMGRDQPLAARRKAVLGHVSRKRTRPTTGGGGKRTLWSFLRSRNFTGRRDG